MKTLDELFAEEEAARIASQQVELTRYDSPEEVAKRELARKEEHAKGVRLGWWDEDGNPLVQDEEDEEDDHVSDA